MKSSWENLNFNSDCCAIILGYNNIVASCVVQCGMGGPGALCCLLAALSLARPAAAQFGGQQTDLAQQSALLCKLVDRVQY